MRFLVALSAAVPTVVTPSEPCRAADAAVYLAATSSELVAYHDNAGQLPVRIHPWTSPVTEDEVKILINKWESGKVASPLAALHKSPAYKALLRVGTTKAEIPKLSRANVEVEAPSSPNCPAAESEYPAPTLGIDFSAIGYTDHCAAAALFIYSRTCYGESYSILEMRQAKDWIVTNRHTLYVHGE